ncbi:hypothetical protein KY289_008285 [Solanum tuberosum]|nr:hypothetical protein KY289_008285 [Solanum tuberosum]
MVQGPAKRYPSLTSYKMPKNHMNFPSQLREINRLRWLGLLVNRLKGALKIGGHFTEVSSSFHGGTIGREALGDSTGLSAKNSGNLVSTEEMHLVTQQQNPHREGKQHVQDLGQSRTSNVDDFNKKKGNESSKPLIDNACPNVNPAYNVSATEFHKIVNDQSKAWVAKEQGNSGSLKTVHVAEPAPYTVVQTYDDRLQNNQAKSDVNIKLTAPEITTKQGLHAVLYVKEEIIHDLAAVCKYTLIGKFSTTMPKVDPIRNNFILQTQLSGGVKIAHFNSRHVYIDLDIELDYNMDWTKQRMTISSKVMRIQVWTPSFKPAEETSIVPIWFSLPELPWHCYNKEFVTGLLSPIGNVIYLDSASIKKTRGSQARVKVQVDLTLKRPSYIWMGYIGQDITDGRWQKIEYDNILDYCFYYKHQGHVENDCTIKQRDEEKRKKDLDNTKGSKESGPQDDHTNLYNQPREQGQKQGQQEDQWQTRRRRNTTQQQVTRGTNIQSDQSTKQKSSAHLEELEIHNGSKQDSRLQPALNQQQEQGEQLRTIPKYSDNIAGKIVSKGQEEAVGGMYGREQGTPTNLQGGVSKQGERGELTHSRHEEVQFDHRGDSRTPVTPLRNQKIPDTQEIIDTRQQHNRFNNKSGERLSKKIREAIKKRMQKNTGQDPDINRAKLLPDDFGALNSEDEVDPDNQSMDESEEDADDTMKQTGPVFGSNLHDKCSDVQRVTEEHGLSPKGRKQTRHIPHQTITSMSDNSSRQMTRSKSKVIEACGLIDLGHTGLIFTWCNQRDAEARVWKRLDRSMANDKWLENLPQTTIENLSSVGSNHSPLLMEMIQTN